MKDKEADFLWTCKTLYLKSIDPFDFDKQIDSDYPKALNLGRDIIEIDGLQYFLSFLLEGQFNVPRWTAFIGLEYINQNPVISNRESIIDKCLKVVNEKILMEPSEVVDRNREEWMKKMAEKILRVES